MFLKYYVIQEIAGKKTWNYSEKTTHKIDKTCFAGYRELPRIN